MATDPTTRRNIEAIGPILSRVMARSGLTQVVAQQKLVGHWKEAVGPELSGRTRLVGLRGNVVRVEVDSAAHLQELATFRKRGILEQLRAAEGSLFVQDIEFRIGSF